MLGEKGQRLFRLASRLQHSAADNLNCGVVAGRFGQLCDRGHGRVGAACTLLGQSANGLQRWLGRRPHVREHGLSLAQLDTRPQLQHTRSQLVLGRQ